MNKPYQHLLDFWFGELKGGFADKEHRQQWFATSDETDAYLRQHFSDLHQQASDGKLQHWLKDDRGCLALIILLDQFSRNLFRGKAEAYQCDDDALALAKEALSRGVDLRLEVDEKLFVYLPLEHSESLQDQEQCVALFEAMLADVTPEHKATVAGYLQYAELHFDIIQRFGRFPHRNAILGRKNRQMEVKFLAEGGSRFGQ